MMQTNATPVAAALLSAGLLAGWFLTTSVGPIPSRQTAERRAIHPVAAMAWQKVRCTTTAELAPDAPRIQAEDLLIMTAELDARALDAGAEIACREARDLAKPVSVEHVSATPDGGRATLARLQSP